MLHWGKAAQACLALALPTSVILVYWLYTRWTSTDDEVYGKKRVVTSRNTVIKVTVPKRAIGAVIGRQGATIKQIQKETGTQLHFMNEGDRDKETDRTLVIHGTAEAAQQVELMIYQIIADLREVLTEEVQVPNYAVGHIIGKGGTSIREITSSSGAKIMIDRNQEGRRMDMPRTVTIVGSRKQIDAAILLLEEKLEEEEEFRSKKSPGGDTRQQHNKPMKEKKHLKSIAVPQLNDSWDAPPSSTSQDDIPLKGCSLEVYVSAVEHPGHFWVQVIGSKALHLEQLQNELTAFSNSEDAKTNYVVTTVIPGDLVAAKYEVNDPTFYRAKILKELPDGQLDLYFVDYGDNTLTTKSQVFKLRSDFTSFPFQAIECQLANVVPVGGVWREEAITLFEDLTHCAQWKPLCAKIVSHWHTQGNQLLPAVHLCDTNGDMNIDISEQLVAQGFATHAADSDSSCPPTAGAEIDTTDTLYKDSTEQSSFGAQKLECNDISSPL